jgi:hypothetical protein
VRFANRAPFPQSGSQSFSRLPSQLCRHPKLCCEEEFIVKKALSTLRDAAGTGALVLMAGTIVFGSYFLIASLPDLKRYIKISTM